MAKVLLIDDDGDHAEQLGRGLAERRLTVTRAADGEAAIAQLRNREHAVRPRDPLHGWSFSPWLEVLRTLQHAGWQAGFREAPLFLCVSRLQLGIDFQLQIERMGARYAYEE